MEAPREEFCERFGFTDSSVEPGLTTNRDSQGETTRKSTRPGDKPPIQ